MPRAWLLAAALLIHHAFAAPLRVRLLADDPTAGAPAALLEGLRLRADLRVEPADPAAGSARLGALAEAEALLVVRGPGPLAAPDAAALDGYLRSGRPVVVVGADPAAWTGAPLSLGELLGATPGGIFSEGRPPTVVSLYPHAVTAGLTAAAPAVPVRLWKEPAEDVFLLAEATVGEATAPLVWMRPGGPRRLVHVLPGDAVSLRDPGWQQLAAQALLWAARQPVPGARPSLDRTVLPDAHPGSFALVFPEGVGVCLDPVRGGLNYLWRGDFVDLRPRWLTKQGAPARLSGPVAYRERAWQPLRGGAPGAAADFRFLGHVTAGGLPHFRYTVGGREVRETITARPAGDGIVRRFRVAAGPAPLWLQLEPQAGVTFESSGAARDGDQLAFSDSAGGEFTVTVRFTSGEARR